MKIRTFSRQNFLTFILAACALGCVTLCTAQTQSTTSVARADGAKAVASAPGHAVASSEEKQAEEKLTGKGLGTRIKVHGHWVIDVKNPDGSLAQHREFENSLQDFTAIPALLSGQVVPGGWMVLLSDSNSADPICGPKLQGVCFIAQTGVTYFGGNTEFGGNSNNCVPTAGVSCNLGLSYGSAPNGSANAFILSGSVTAAGSGQITSVATQFYSCSVPLLSTGAPVPNTFSPAQCAANASGAGQVNDLSFTGTALANPITGIQPGQTIAVVVYLSFQ